MLVTLLLYQPRYLSTQGMSIIGTILYIEAEFLELDHLIICFFFFFLSQVLSF